MNDSHSVKTGILHQFSTAYGSQPDVDEFVLAESQQLLVEVLKQLDQDRFSHSTPLQSLIRRTAQSLQVSSAAKDLVDSFFAKAQYSQAELLLQSYLLALKSDDCSESTIKNYRSDIRQFFAFTQETTLQKVFTKPKVAQFLRNEKTKGLTKSSIRRKVVSISQFAIWLELAGVIRAHSQQWLVELSQHFDEIYINQLTSKVGLTERTLVKPIKPPLLAEVIANKTQQSENISQVAETSLLNPQDRLSQLKQGAYQLFSKVTGTSKTHLAPYLNQLLRLAKHSQNSKNTLKLIQLYSHLTNRSRVQLLPYLNLLLSLILFLGMGYFGYLQIFGEVEQPLAFPSALTRPNRTLSFQGRLTDTAQNPILVATNMKFRLYDSGPSTSGGTLLWDSGTCSVTPDQDGIFAVGLGADCGGEIGSSVFSENANVWLQVEVAAEVLSPRQSIKSVAYALNSETLQGYPASASAVENTVVIMNNSGEIVLGNANPVLKATGTSFAIEAQTLTLRTSSGSNGNIILDPDGTGRINLLANVDVNGYIKAPGATLSATYAGGTALTLNAGPSATADIMRWQNSAGSTLGVIDSSGNMGIGASTAATKLDVDTGSNTLGLRLRGTAETTEIADMYVGANGELIFNTIAGNDAAQFIDFRTESTQYGLVVRESDGTGATTFANIFVTDATDDYLSISLNGATSTSALNIAAGNNVGIGSSAPGYKLDVAGTGRFTGALKLDSTLLDVNTQAGTSGQILSSTATGVDWVDLPAAGANYWKVSNGTVSPFSDTLDLLVGSGATASAKFAVLNVNSGTPTASISSGVSGTSMFMTADGTLATTKRTNLTIGNSSTYDTTGDVLLNPNGTGNIGVGTTSTGAKLDVTGTGRFSSTLTASNGLTLTTGALNLTATSGTLTLSGMSASSLNFGANNVTFTAGNFNTTATGINSTAIGATTPSTGAFTTLSSTGVTTLGNNSATVAINSSDWDISTTGDMTGIGAITMDGNFSQTGATTFSTGTGAVSLNGATTVANGNTFTANGVVVLGDGGDNFSVDSNALDISTGGAITGATGVVSSGTITFSGLTADRLVATTTGGTLTNTISSANAGLSFSDETGSGLVVFGTSPTITTSLIAGGASFDLLNTTATTINFGGAASTLNIGPGGATATSVNVAGGSGATGCTVDGATGNLTCTGSITGSGATGYWTRVAGNLSPATVNDTISATSSASTVATFTTNNAAGTLTNNTLINHSAAGTVTNLLNLTQSAGTVSNGLTFTGTFGNLISATNFNVTNAGAVTAVGVNSGSGLLQGTGGLTLTGTTSINGSGTASTTIGNSAGGTITIGAATGSNLVLNDADWSVTGAGTFSGPVFQGNSGAVTFGNVAQATTITGSGLTVVPTAWTATPTISGLITATSGLTANGALTANNVFTLGDNGDTGSVNTSDWDISTAGTMTGISGITNDSTITSTGGIISLNASSNFAVNIGTGTTTSTVSIGGNANQVAIDSSTWDITGAGIASGLTGLTSSGTITFSGLTANRAVFTTTGGQLTSTGASADLLNSLSDETGTGIAVFGTSPTITTSLISGGTSFDLLNTVATGTINFGGVAGTINIGPGGATATSVNVAGGSGATGCTVDGATGNMACSGTITGAGAVGYWQNANGALSPASPYTNNSDLLIGSNASASAKFAVLNVYPGTSGSPTASVSSGLSGTSMFMTADGSLSTTRRSSLYIGNSAGYNTSGNVLINSNGTGNVGIGTTGPSNELEINGDVELTNLYDNDASNFFDGGCSATTTMTGIDSTGAITCTTITGVAASSIAFSGITSGTNTTAAMVVGAGATLDYTSTGTINASSLIGGTWAIPGTIGSTTPNSGAFTTLSSTGVTTLGNNSATVAVNSSDWDISTAGAMTGISGITNDSTITSTGGIISLNASSNFAVNIGTGTTNSTVSIGGNANQVAIDSSTWDITGGGVASGLTGLTSSGTITFSGLTADRLVTTTTGGQLTNTISSANVGLSISDETGSGLIVFNTSPEINTSITTGSSSFDLLNATATTINFGGAASTLNIGPGSTTATSVNIAGGSGATGCTVDGATGNLTCTGAISGSNTTNYWQYANGALSPSTPYTNNSDLLVGSNATASAKFAILNIYPGTAGSPTASVSSGLNGTSLFMTADGSLSTTRRSNLTIGNSASYDTTGNVLINPLGTGNVGIGSTSPNDKLDVTGEIDTSTFYKLAGSKILDVENTSTLILGYSAGAALTAGGTLNTLLGQSAGTGVTTGDRITSVGHSAGFQLSSGTDSTFLGAYSGYYNNGDYNTFVGASAGYGSGTGISNYNNTAVGYNALQTIAANDDGNAAFGYEAGNAFNGGDNNSFLGTSTGAEDSVSNSVMLGRGSWALASNQLVIGDDAASAFINDVYIGEGVTSASPSDFTINATGGLGTDIAGANFNLAGGKGTGNADGGDLIFLTANAGASSATLQSLTEKMRLTDEGNLGIGSTAAIYKLDVNGTGRLTGALKLDSTLLDVNNQAGTSGQVLSSTVTGVDWVDTASLGTNYWKLVSGTVSPFSDTLDLLVGSGASASAKFAVLNVNSGTPTASVSSGVSGTSMFMTADGTLSTTKRTALTIGNSSTYDTTGNVLLQPNGGNVGIGTTFPSTGLHLNSDSGLKISRASNADQQLTLLGGDGSGLAQIESSYSLQIKAAGTNPNGYIKFITGASTETMRINYTGNVGIGSATPGTTLDVTGTGRFSSTLTASNGFTVSTGALNLTGTSGALILSGMSTSSLSFGANNVTFTAGNFNTTATGINTTPIGATTPSTAAFTTLSSTGVTALGNNSATVAIDSSVWDITGAGVASGLTGLSSSGTINFSGLTASRAVFTDGSKNLVSSAASAALLDALTDETGTGVSVFGTSPTITTSLIAGSASFDLLNTTATTINFGGAASALNIGPGGATATSINMAGGSGATGCTVDGATGNLTCSGIISSTAAVGFWQYVNGAISPSTPYTNNSDLLIGSNASDSAKFAILNVFPGTAGSPTASVSSGLNGTSMFMTADGSLSTQNRMSLTIGNKSGNDTTGNVLINSNGIGYVGVGTTNPIRKLSVETDGASNYIKGSSYGTGFDSGLLLYSPRGTQAAPTVNLTGDQLGSIHFRGFDTAESIGARMYALAAADWGTAGDTSDNPTDLRFSTVPDGSATEVDVLTIASTGNVGIGTTNPQSTLELASTGNTQLNIRGGSSTLHPVLALIDEEAGGVQWNIENGREGDGILGFYTGGTKMVINNSGNVGIGTTTPTSTIGWQNIVDLYDSVNAGYRMHAAATAQESGIGTDGVGLYVDVAGHATATNNNIYFRTEETNSSFTPTARMTIASDGNVGIGTTAPGTKLSVSTSIAKATVATTYASIITSSDASLQQQLIFGLTGGASSAARTATIQSLEQGVGYNSLLLNPLGGNVGIGSVTPGYKLDIVSTVASDGLRITNSAVGGPFIVLNASNATPANRYAGVVLQSGGTDQWATELRGGDGNLYIYDVVNAQARMTVTPAGNVGIGSITPTAKLDVDGNIALTGSNPSTISSESIMRLDIDSNNNSTADYLDFTHDVGTSLMRIEELGNVGIGTTAPTALGSGGSARVLQVHNSGTAANSFGMLNLTSGSTAAGVSGALAFGIPSLSGAEKRLGQIIMSKMDALTVNPIGNMYFDTANGGVPTTKMTIQADGNVGIGTTGPTDKLDIHHGANGAGISVNNSLTAVNSSSRLSFDFGTIGTTAYIETLKPLAGTTGTNIKNDMSFNLYDGASWNLPLYLQSSGNVGIGTTTPDAQLDVAAATGTTPYTPATIKIRSLTNSTGYDVDSTWGNLDFHSNDVTIPGNTVRARIGAGYVQNNGTGGDLIFYTSPIAGPLTANMTIDGNGSVGIGTITPSALLHAVGTGASPSLSSDAGNVFKITTTTTPELAFGGYAGTPYGMWMQVKRIANDGNTYPLIIQPLGGNVGIGTTTPGAALEVDGTIKLSSTASYASLIYNADPTLGAFTITGASAGSDYWSIFGDGASNAGVLHIRTGDDNTEPIYFEQGTNIRMAVTGTGNIGIGSGITTTSRKLTVSTTGSTDGISIDGTVNPALALLTSGTLRGYFAAATATDAYFTGAAANDIIIRAEAGADIHMGSGAGVPDLSISSGGNVGIGTTVANAPLSFSTAIGTGFLNTYAEYKQIFYDGGTAGASYGTGIIGSTMVFNSGGGAYNFDKAGTGTAMAIDTAGNVGIGITAPTSELHVGGTTPELRIGDDGAEDSSLAFMGNAADYHIGLDDTDDLLKFGLGTALGTTTYMSINTFGEMSLDQAGAKNAGSTGLQIDNVTTNTTADNTNKYGIYINSTGTATGGAGTANRNYGLYVNAVSGSDTNYGAYFNGSVGIMAIAPTQALDVTGRIALSNWAADGDTVAYRDTTTNSIALVTSDRRLKKNIVPLTGALDIVNQLNTYKYNDLDEADGAKLRLGFMGQEVLPLMPELTYQFYKEGSSETYYGVHYDKMPVLLLQAMKELSAMVDEQGNKGITFNSEGELSINGNTGNYTVIASGNTLTTIIGSSKAVIAKITAGLINTRELVVTQSATIADLTVTNLQVSGQSISDYIRNIVQQELQTTPLPPEAVAEDFTTDTLQVNQDATISGTLATTGITTETITASTSALGSLLAETASISGDLTVGQDASVAGTLIAGNIDAESSRFNTLEARMAELEHIKAQTADLVDATISGTLYADSIYNFDEKVAESFKKPTLLDLLTQPNENPVEAASPASIYEPVETAGYQSVNPDLIATDSAILSLNESDVVLGASALFVEKYLEVNGFAYVSQTLGIGNTLKVGNSLVITNGTIDYHPAGIAAPVLAIQSSGQGKLDFLAGVMTIESGHVKVTGNMTVAGALKTDTLLTNLAQPADFGTPFQVQVAGVSTESGEIKKTRFEIINETGQAVASFDADGNASFQGGVSIGNQNLIAEDSSDDAVTTDKSSGKAKLTSGKDQLKIQTPKATPDSLIYVTPKGSTENKVLFIKAQGEGEFTVGFDSAIGTDVEFNWWIVN